MMQSVSASLVPMLMGPPLKKKRKPAVGLRVYTKTVESSVDLGPPVLIPQILFRSFPPGVLPLL